VPGLFEGHAVKIVDVESGRSRLLTSNFGGFPAWSPDGRHIALTDRDGNLCLMAPEGGTARIVAQGRDMQWSHDSRHLYFRKASGSDGLYSIDIEDPHPAPVEMMHMPGSFVPCDERGWMAFGTPTGIRLVDIVSGSVRHHCRSPWPLPHWQLHRSPSGRELSFASMWSYFNIGPFILDTETKELYQVLDYPARQILWSPDGSKVAVVAAAELWMLDVDAHLPIHQRLGRKIPGGDLVGYELAKLDRAIAADPLYPENYLERAVAYLSVGRYAEAESDLRQFDTLVTSDDHHIGHALFWWLKECYANGLHEAAARLAPYAERFMERFPVEAPSFRSLIVEMVERHERDGRIELAGRWKERLQRLQSQGN
jgi:hypothetical protein